MLTFLFKALILITSFIFFSQQYSFSQIKFKAVPGYQMRSSDNMFFDITETRSIIPLNGKWTVRTTDEEEVTSVEINVPSIFEGETELIFEKEFTLTKSQIAHNTSELIFF